METCPTSVLNQYPRGYPAATRLNICYCNQDLLQGLLHAASQRHFMATPVSLYMLWPCTSGVRHSTLPYGYREAGLGTIHFRSCALQQVSCYTFLSGFQPSWPPSCYL